MIDSRHGKMINLLINYTQMLNFKKLVGIWKTNRSESFIFTIKTTFFKVASKNNIEVNH